MRVGLERMESTLRFRTAVPLASTKECASSKLRVTGKKNKKKKNQKHATSAPASEQVDESSSQHLAPSDIPRVRLFLCHEGDIKDGQLPQIHVEVDPCESLHAAILNLQNISRSSNLVPSKPHTGHQWYLLNRTITAI